MTRGSFLDWLLGAAAAALAGLGLGGAKDVLSPPAGLGGHVTAWRKVLEPDELPPDGGTVKRVVAGTPYIIRLTGDTLHAWSAVCPHAGCAVKWTPSNPGFTCDCHHSRFNADGAPISGPAAQPLRVVEVRWGRGDVVELFV